MSQGKFSKRWKIVLIVVPAAVVLVIAAGTAAARTYLADNPAACGNCHIMQPYVQSYLSPNFMDNVHAVANPVVKCEDCHRQSLPQQASELMAFLQGTKIVPVQDPNVQAGCLNCHSIDKIISAVKIRPEFVANPGSSYHLNAANAKACANPQAELVKCQDCHKAHEAPVNYCSNCHSSNFGVPDNNRLSQVE